MMAVLFDSHSHINNETYTGASRGELVRAIEASDVGYVTDIGFDVESSALAAEHATKYPWCYAAVGVHPSEVGGMTEDDIERLRALAKLDGVVAIGEIGIDYHYDDAPSAEDQRYWFGRQLDLGLELGLPIVIHDRDTDGETLAFLKERGAFGEARILRFAAKGSVEGDLAAGSADAACGSASDGRSCGAGMTGGSASDERLGSADAAGDSASDGRFGGADARILLHCFSGDADDALAAVELGAWISVAGPVTYKSAKKTRRVCGAVPLSRLLIETDAPYLTPEPHRGKPNMSPYVEFTARKIAEVRGINYEEVAEATTANAKRFYGIE